MDVEEVFSHWTDTVSVSNISEQYDLTNQSEWLKKIQNIKNDLIKLEGTENTEDIRFLLRDILRKQLFSTGFLLLGTIINKGDSKDIQKLKNLILKIKKSETFDNIWPKTLYEIIKSKNPNIEKLGAAEKLCLNVLGELFGKIHLSMPQYNACSREVLEHLGYPEVNNYQDFQKSFELFKKIYDKKIGKLSENKIPINVEIDQMFNYFHKTENNEFVDGFWKKNKSSSQYSDVNFWLVAAGREAEREKIWNEFKNNNIIGVGWNKTGDVTGLSRKKIISLCEKVPYEQGAHTLVEFVKIKPNDIVFVNDGKQGFFGIAKVIGPYRFDTQYPINHHVFPVEWISTSYQKLKPLPGNPTAGVSRIVKNKKSLFKYLNGMSEKTTDYSDVEEYEKVLKKSKQIILFGAPGTGKTYHSKLLAESFTKSSSSPKMTFRSAAITVLKEHSGPMHYVDIWKNVSKQNLVETQGKTPAETLLSSITADIKQNDDSSVFTKTDTGTYELNSEVQEELKILETEEENKNQFIETVTFHPSYSYEDFIEGIKPSMNKGKISYSLQDGIFKQICERASSDLGNSYVLLIDEINRGNVSKIFGELISILETGYRGDNVTLAYSKKPFNVPKNLHIIGTMNTADRSLVQIDTALRRRFSFIELMPKPELLTKTINGISLRLLLEKINDKIIKSGLREKQVGHTYFLNVKNIQDLQFVFSNQIIPLLQDYFFDDYKKLKKDILSEHFINDSKMSVKEDWKTDSKIFVNALKKTFGL